MADPMEDLRALMEEARALPLANGGTSLADMATNDWSVWTKRRKSLPRLDSDRRAAYVLERLNQKYPRLHAYENIPEPIRAAADFYRKSPSTYTSAYEDREGDYPIWHAAQWAQSMPAAIYATGKMLGNEVHEALGGEGGPHPEAYDNYEYALNTLTGNALGANKPSYWREQSNVAPLQKESKTGIFPSGVRDRAIAERVHKDIPVLEAGRDFLEDSGTGPDVAKFAGPVMDAFLSWPSSIRGISQLPARSLKGAFPAAAKAAGMTALGALMEVAPDVAMANPDTALKTYDNYWKGKLPWEE